MINPLRAVPIAIPTQNDYYMRVCHLSNVPRKNPRYLSFTLYPKLFKSLYLRNEMTNHVLLYVENVQRFPQEALHYNGAFIYRIRELEFKIGIIDSIYFVNIE